MSVENSEAMDGAGRHPDLDTEPDETALRKASGNFFQEVSRERPTENLWRSAYLNAMVKVAVMYGTAQGAGEADMDELESLFDMMSKVVKNGPGVE